jgi:hypothetical protein
LPKPAKFSLGRAADPACRTGRQKNAAASGPETAQSLAFYNVSSIASFKKGKRSSPLCQKSALRASFIRRLDGLLIPRGLSGRSDDRGGGKDEGLKQIVCTNVKRFGEFNDRTDTRVLDPLLFDLDNSVIRDAGLGRQLFLGPPFLFSYFN